MRSFLNFCLFVAFCAIIFNSCKKDDKTSDITQINFNSLSLAYDTFWNGSNNSGGFTCGNATFPNSYTSATGSYPAYWSGFAYSNQQDTQDTVTTTSTLDIFYQYYFYGIKPASNIFTLAYVSDTSSVTFTKPMNGLSIEVGNNTYTALAMKHGDTFSKKFTNKSQDWFMLTIIGYNGTVRTDTVNVYLANFQFADSVSDYIVKNWREVNLSTLGTVTKISFTLSSSDNSYGYMNTPAYFCLGNLQGVLQ